MKKLIGLLLSMLIIGCSSTLVKDIKEVKDDCPIKDDRVLFCMEEKIVLDHRRMVPTTDERFQEISQDCCKRVLKLIEHKKNITK